MKTRRARTALALASLVVAAAACSSGDGTADTARSSAADPNTDKLAQILGRETLVLSTDPAYPPQSFAV